MTDHQKTSLPYRDCVGMMILNRQGLIFVGRRLDAAMKAWQMPQGGINEGEEPEAAALRELEEEIGTANVRILAQTDDWLSYDLPGDLVGKVWNGKYRGQRQRWFVMRFLGQDSEFLLETEHPEFCDWKWIPIEQLDRDVIPFKRQLYNELKNRFQNLAIPGE